MIKTGTRSGVRTCVEDTLSQILLPRNRVPSSNFRFTTSRHIWGVKSRINSILVLPIVHMHTTRNMVLLHILWLKLPALIVAHEGAGFPKIVGGRLFPAELRNRNIFTTSDLNNERNVNSDHASRLHIKRANCGPGVGSCAANECCSSGGYVAVKLWKLLLLTIFTSVCGTGTGFCAGPDCQFSYGPACDANTIPIGASTAGIARTKVGSVSYGTRINSCVQDNVFSLTFDDGPFSYTSALLDLLDQYNAKATFFISASRCICLNHLTDSCTAGNNNGKRPIDDCSTSYPAIIKVLPRSQMRHALLTNNL